MKACPGCGRRVVIGFCTSCARRRIVPRQERGHGAEFQRLRLQVIAEDRACGICGVELEPNEPVDVDYIVPYSKGGECVRDNLQATHPSCNRAKGAR